MNLPEPYYKSHYLPNHTNYQITLITKSQGLCGTTSCLSKTCGGPSNLEGRPNQWWRIFTALFLSGGMIHQMNILQRLLLKKTLLFLFVIFIDIIIDHYHPRIYLIPDDLLCTTLPRYTVVPPNTADLWTDENWRYSETGDERSDL